MKTLKLTSPPTRSDVALQVQKKLGLRTDGIYGPVTAGAVKRWKWLFGYHKKHVNQDFTRSDYAYLFGKKPKTKLMQVRAKRRRPKPEDLGMRGSAVKVMSAWADARLVELPANSNKVPRLQDIGRSHGVKPYYAAMGWPWCAYSVMLAALTAGSTTAKQGLVEGKFNPLYVPEIESLARAGRFGMRQVGWGEARPGDFVVFNWDGGVSDHIGMLVSIDGPVARCVEGNTSPTSAGSQSNGGGVYIRNRDRSSIQSLIRWS